MTSVTEAPRSSPFDADRLSSTHPRDLTMLSTPAPNSHQSSAEPMDISPHSASANKERTPVNGNGSPIKSTEREGTSSAASVSQPVGAAAAANQPKVVQAAFIHKLYNMLEDQSITHLIAWTTTNESFVMSPSTEFSKVLASYFKHTNISSFVRQLNMYGFHKVSDVFHAGSPDSPLWEFKHGAGSFKRGDLAGLRDIKRRASRQTLIHRDSFSGPTTRAPTAHVMPAPVQPEAPPAPPETLESRIQMMEYNFHDVFTRLGRADDALRSLTSRCQALADGLSRCVHYSGELSQSLLAAVPDPDNKVHKDVAALRAEITRHADGLKLLEPLARPAPGPMYEPTGGTSPRHTAFDPARRPSLQITGPPPSTFRAPLPPSAVSPRRQNSLSVPDQGLSPSAARTQYHNLPPPPIPAQPHPLSNVSSPPSNLLRRHTSADIRVQGWQAGAPPPQGVGSPYASGQNSSQWPSSPFRAAAGGDQQLRDALAQYELPKLNAHIQRHTTPPPDAGGPHGQGNTVGDAGWSLPGPKFPFRNVDFSAPPTRRSSMASNVHSLLNPAETAEREGEDEPIEERKRKRVV